MTEIALRFLGPEDAGLILATPEGLFDRRPDPEQTAAFLASPDHRIAVALAEGRIVSFASGQRMLHPDKPPAFFINEVGTAEAWRRQGLASTVVTALVAAARAMGCQGIWLATEGDNAAARALYRALGAGETQDVVVFDWDGAMAAEDG